MPALNLNRGLADLNRGSNSLNSISCNSNRFSGIFFQVNLNTKLYFLSVYKFHNETIVNESYGNKKNVYFIIIYFAICHSYFITNAFLCLHFRFPPPPSPIYPNFCCMRFIERGEEGQPHQSLVRTTFSSFSRPPPRNPRPFNIIFFKVSDP